MHLMITKKLSSGVGIRKPSRTRAMHEIARESDAFANRRDRTPLPHGLDSTFRPFRPSLRSVTSTGETVSDAERTGRDVERE
jgi:hypothetical protein